MKRYRFGYCQFKRTIIASALASLILFMFIPFAAAAPEQPSIEWSKTYGGLQATSVIQTADGGYAMAGIALSSGGATMIKTDPSGNIQWQENLGDAVSLAQTSDLNYILFCIDGDIVKTDTEGKILFSFSVGVGGVQLYPLSSYSSGTGVREGIISSEGTYIIVGNSIGDNGEAYAWLRKTDSQGNVLWDKNFTGGFHISRVVETADRGFALAGNWKTDFWLARLDSNGNLMWSQPYAYGGLSDSHFVYSLVTTKDGGLILGGGGDWQSSGGMVPWIIKFDSQGHEQWSLPYGQYPNDAFSNIVQTPDQGYVLVQAAAATLTRTDSSAGEFWRIHLGVASTWTPLNYPFSSLILTNDGGYAIAGASMGNAFLVKISPEDDLQPPIITISSPKSKNYEEQDLPLTFTLSKPASWLGYSLDGQQPETISGNFTLTDLSVGTHNLTVYARDQSGLVGTSETIQFTITARFPMELFLVVVGVAIAASTSFLLYVKRKEISEYKKRGLRSLIKKPNLRVILKNRLAWTLIIMSLCFILVFIQIFFPYVYYSSSKKAPSPFEVGVSYVYEQDAAGQIYNEVSHIKDLGFSVIRINLVSDSSNPNSYLNTLSNVFFSATKQLGIKVALIINNHDSTENIQYYLETWGRDVTYIQILNEPDVATSWDLGALFTDDEAISKFEEIYSIVDQHKLPALLYTNFGPAFVVRTNLPVRFSEKLDFVGFDVFMDSFLTIAPNMIQFLHKITDKEVVIAEYGMSTSDETAQSNYIISGLNLFKNMGLRGCWIVYWNSVDNNYGIRGKLAERNVGEWIAENA